MNYQQRVKEQQGIKANLGGVNQFCAISLEGGLERFQSEEFESCFDGYRTLNETEVTESMILKFGRDLNRGMLIEVDEEIYFIIPTDPWITIRELFN